MAGRKGRSGRRPKPRELHLVDGTFRPDRHGSADEAREQARAARAEPLPYAPRWLDDLAKREWRRIAPLLHRRSLLDRRDLAALAAYCRAYAELQHAQAELDRQGRTVTTDNGNLVPHPAVGRANTAAKQMRDFIIEFGLTPSSRARLEVSPKGGAGDADEEWLEQANRRSGADR